MMPRSLALVALLAAPAATAAPPELHQSVRTLQRLQDAMISGEADAQAVRIKLLSEIGKQASHGAADRKNTRAAIIYALSGGKAKVGAEFLKTAEADLQPLLEGAIAYAQDDKAKAAELLLPLDLRELPADLAGQIALVRSALRRDGEQELMRADLRLARALMPGTLIEEAALRRSAALAAEMRDRDEFETAAGRYFRRFPRSIYTGQFAEAFAVFVESLDYDAMPERLTFLETLSGALPPERAAHVYLEIARHALLRGRRALAQFAAEKAADAATPGIQAARAALYQGAVLIATDATRFEEALKLLESVDRGRLIAADIALLSSALTLARHLTIGPAEAQPSPDAREPNEPSPIAEKAGKALADAESAMKENDP